MSPSSDRRPGRLSALLVLLVAGTIGAGAWLTAFSTERSQRAQDWSELTHQVTEDVLISHLWLEEAVGGDASVDVQDQVLAPLERAGAQCRVLRDGGQFRGGDVTPLNDVAPRAPVDRLCAEVAQFEVLARARLADATGTTTTGTASDTAFDQEFEQIRVLLDQARAQVDQAQVDDRATVTRFGYGITGLLALLLLGIVAVGRLHSRSVAELGRRNEVILDAAGEGIVGVDADGIAVFANPAAGTLSGHDDEHDLVGRHLHGVAHGAADAEADHPAAACPLLGSIRADQPGLAHDDVFWRPDGTSFPVEYTASVVEEDGVETGAVIVFRDVTERREVEQMKDQFVSVVSHELRTPLTSIHGSLGLLAGGALGAFPAPAQRMLDIATTNTDRLIRLINDILDIERMRSGAIRMEREVIEAAEVVESAVSSMHGLADDAEVTLTTDTESALVWADRDRLTQVLVNLLGNAVKFSPPGGEVSVTLAARGDTLTVDVADRGRGIPEDKLGSIFGRFQQVDASDAREKGGTGLGLAISESIVVQHDGRIWAERRPGGGTVIKISLPAVQRHEPDTPDRDPGRPRVLVVDDDPLVLEVVCAILEREGYATTSAATGDEAVAKAIESPPDAVVLDLLMPRTSGWDVLRALRDNSTTSDVPAVILSVLAEGEEEVGAADYDEWVAKPFDDEALVTALTRALESHGDGIRAVIVEDDDDLAAVLMATFAGHGIDARRAATAVETRALVPQVEPDLIVLDLHLPDGDGVEVLHDLRAAGHLRGVPVVVYTGYDIEPEDRDQLDRDGAVVFTKTRVSPQEFEQRVLELIGALVDHVPEGAGR